MKLFYWRLLKMLGPRCEGAALAVFILAGCAPVAPVARAPWVATFSIPGDILSQVLPEGERVEVLVPGGASLHEYEPNPRQIDFALKSPFVISMGLGLEPWLPKVETGSGQTRVVLGDWAGPLANEDPHVWLDPLWVKSVVPALAAAVKKARPDLGPRVDVRALQFAGQLESLHRWALGRLPRPSRPQKILTGHGVLRHFAARYEISVESLHGRSSADGVATGDFVKAVARVKAGEVSAWLSEADEEDPLGKALCQDTGLLALGPVYLEKLSPAQGKAPTYLSLMSNLVTVIAEARGAPRSGH